MRTLLLILGLSFLLGTTAQAVPLPKPKKELLYIDLQPVANLKLKDNFHSSAEGNNLGSLSTGEHKFAGVKFKIGVKVIQLGSKELLTAPAKVEGLKVNATIARLHFLHATGWGAMTPENTVIGTYTIHYQDKTRTVIDIVYGKDVRDWWYGTDSPGVTRGKVAWTGDNPHAKKLNSRIRLYLTTWNNPFPKKKILTIDYASTRTTHAAPFCVAMTAEGK